MLRRFYLKLDKHLIPIFIRKIFNDDDDMVKRFYDPNSSFPPQRRLMLPHPVKKYVGSNNMNVNNDNDLSSPIPCGPPRDSDDEYSLDEDDQFGFSQEY